MHMSDGKGGDGGLIQGGITTDARKLYPPIAHEPTTQTGLHNIAGTISMANSGAGTAKADFFILLSDMPGLDANGPGGDATGFAAFGHVVEGMDVVKKIFDSPRLADLGCRRHEGPDARPQDQDHQSCAADAALMPSSITVALLGVRDNLLKARILPDRVKVGIRFGDCHLVCA